MSQVPSEATRRARHARVQYSHCPVCNAVAVDGAHVDRCEELRRYQNQALAAGRHAGIPDVTTLDLHAHLSNRSHNALIAALAVEAVIDLGWRPVVGTDEKRLWTREDAT